MAKRHEGPADRFDAPKPFTDEPHEAVVAGGAPPADDKAGAEPWYHVVEEHKAEAAELGRAEGPVDSFIVEPNTDAAAEASTEPAALSPTPSAADVAGMQFDLPLDEPPAPTAPDIRTEPGEMPSFVREAERAARWQQPHVRAALMLACLAAGLALAGQWMLAQRDLLAARSPALKPALEAACLVVGCRIEAPRALEALRVESSGLTRVERSELYRLNVALRNLRTHEVALPAIELALTDAQGQLIARRVLSAAELGARVATLGPGLELGLQSTLQVGGSGAVAGYTIELFYP